MSAKEFAKRVEVIRRLLVDRSLYGVILVEEASVNWLYQGHYHIGIATHIACVEVLVTSNDVEVLVNSIEVERLQREEHLVGDRLIIYPWYDESLRDVTKTRWLSLQNVVEEQTIKEDIASVRYVLTGASLQAVRTLGQETALAIEEVSPQLWSGQTEHEVAGLVAQACLRRGIEPIVNLIASASRAICYRHGTPTNQKLGEYAILSVGARRHGLTVSMTRMIFFDKVPDLWRQRYEAVLRVHASLLKASQIGQTLGEAFQEGVAAYAKVGYPQEWKQHHQGGIAGYLSREKKAVADTSLRLQAGMVVAWNPTIQGVKAEDTYLIEAQGNVNVTAPVKWPTIVVEDGEQQFVFPDILVM